MPSYLLKVERGRDEYVGWSDVVEAPVFVGDESVALRWLQDQKRCSEPCCYQKQVLDRLERARRTGTSSLNGFYEWGNDLIAEQRGFLPRECVGLYARALLVDDNRDEADSYLQPFEDEVFE